MLVLVAFPFVILLYLYNARSHYWSKKNVKHDPPLPLFGNHLPNLLVRRTVPDMSVGLYNKFNGEKIVGYYRGFTPELIIRDPEIARHILDLDFMHFYSRGGRENPKKLQHNLMFVDGDQWHLMRQRTSSAFSAGRLRAMFPLIVQCTDKLRETMKNLTARDDVIDAYALMSQYAINFVISCGLGLEIDTDISEYSYLIQLTRKIANKSNWKAFLIALEELYPEMYWLKRARYIELAMAKMVLDITKKVRMKRGSKISSRHDYVDILLEIEALGEIRLESPFNKHPDGSPLVLELEMDVECAAAQAFVFLLGGYETSATLLSFTLHQLAFHPDIQHKIHQEIDMVLSKYNQNLCYDAIGELSYLNMALKESMRILPPIGFVRRKCVKRYSIPGTNVTIDPGVRVLIPNQALHMDPKYFDDPNEFRPERFTPEAVKKRHQYVYLPFGEGPRKCPAVRLAEVESLAGLAALLQHFTVLPAPSSQRQHRIKKSSQLMQVLDGGVPIRFKPRTSIN